MDFGQNEGLSRSLFSQITYPIDDTRSRHRSGLPLDFMPATKGDHKRNPTDPVVLARLRKGLGIHFGEAGLAVQRCRSLGKLRSNHPAGPTSCGPEIQNEREEVVAFEPLFGLDA